MTALEEELQQVVDTIMWLNRTVAGTNIPTVLAYLPGVPTEEDGGQRPRSYNWLSRRLMVLLSQGRIKAVWTKKPVHLEMTFKEDKAVEMAYQKQLKKAKVA